MFNPTKDDILKSIDLLVTQVGNGYHLDIEDITIVDTPAFPDEDKMTHHDITVNGKSYILDWTHDDNGRGWVSITETCDDSSEHDEEMHNHESYDFQEVA